MRTWNGKWDGPECGTWWNGPQQKTSLSQHKLVVRTFSVQTWTSPNYRGGKHKYIEKNKSKRNNLTTGCKFNTLLPKCSRERIFLPVFYQVPNVERQSSFEGLSSHVVGFCSIFVAFFLSSSHLEVGHDHVFFEIHLPPVALDKSGGRKGKERKGEGQNNQRAATAASSIHQNDTSTRGVELLPYPSLPPPQPPRENKIVYL